MAAQSDRTNDNNKLNKANKVKDDEFYTQLKDIEKELPHYQDYFKDKIILCNCDDPSKSNFFKYFAINFDQLGIKQLIATYFNANKPVYRYEVNNALSLNKDGNIDLTEVKKTPLQQQGDFQSSECIEILKSADIVVTNPPFSLFRAFIEVLMQHEKQFLVIGNSNAISYKDCFEYIMNDQMWLGYNNVRWFYKPDGTLFEAARSFWYTNLDNLKRHKRFELDKTFCADDYPQYDNIHAIEVGKAKNIPIDYSGVMGVPITFIDKYNPDQFEIVGLDYHVKEGRLPHLVKSEWQGKLDRAYLKGKRLYSRVLIRHNLDNTAHIIMNKD
ncbi:adenine-specific methyltransferase EcoRI family protein [Psychrobacter sp. FDAARGOS_221]|uniref:adenine-specific methyltransferase EcoRI family protein n=1 Tax=Psychrobacter sp. FDAARGOS_221 TaxID=1975705 RepID=UPI000BB576B0|nr:adenine-specific methyltransferase EcoRI family protein [Psychrobacter sp. FDAARGOS_221]PNK61689.1 modification methylase [Psychrobacter sp. FDAARGOS_221]